MQFRLKYTGIRVKNIEDSLHFYTEKLGMEVVGPLEPTPPTEGQAVTLQSPGSTNLLELNWYVEGSRYGPPYSNGEDLDHIAFECEDLGKAVAELERRGVEVTVRPNEIGASEGWNEAFVKDPNGIWIELLQARRNPPDFGRAGPDRVSDMDPSYPKSGFVTNVAETVVRDLAWGDFPSVAQIYLALYDELRTNRELGVTLFEKPPSLGEEVGFFASLYRSVLDGDSVSVVAEVQGRVAGICTVTRKGPAPESRHIGGLTIFVGKASRGQGIGRALMRLVLERCRGRFEFVELSVFTSNTAARELYHSLGFRTWGTLPKAILRDGKYTGSEHMVVSLERPLDP